MGGNEQTIVRPTWCMCMSQLMVLLFYLVSCTPQRTHNSKLSLLFLVNSEPLMSACAPSPNFHFCFMRPPNHGQFLTSDGRVCHHQRTSDSEISFCFWTVPSLRWPCGSPLQTFLFVLCLELLISAFDQNLSPDGCVRPLSKLSFCFMRPPAAFFNNKKCDVHFCQTKEFRDKHHGFPIDLRTSRGLPGYRYPWPS